MYFRFPTWCSLFAHLGGFDEFLFDRGRSSSLLDCELSARVWSKGLAVVLARVHTPTAQKIHKPFIQRMDVQSAAWGKGRPSMLSGAREYARCMLMHLLSSITQPVIL